MRTIGLGCQSFQNLMENNLFYVDKTLFLGKWYRSYVSVTLITRPRRFGKTLMLDMVDCFFSQTYAGRQELFQNLQVGKDANMMALQGTFPVISISYANESPVSMDAFLDMIRSLTAHTYLQYTYLLEGDTLNAFEKQKFKILLDDVSDPPAGVTSKEKLAHHLKESLMNLSIWLERYHGKKVMILMDEYDTPLQEAYVQGYWQDAIMFMREMFGKTLKKNPALDRALVTGITRIAKESLFSDLNHMDTSSILMGGYEDAFGFTQNDMESIMKEYDLKAHENEIKTMYDGFTIGKVKNLYNPWSICSYLKNDYHELLPYWANTGGITLIRSLLESASAEILSKIQTLMLGQDVECQVKEELVYPELTKNPAAIWSLLLSSGYLRLSDVQKTPDGSKKHLYTLTFTNQETRDILIEMAQGWLVNDQTTYSHDFVNAMLHTDVDAMNATLQEIVRICVSSFDLGTHPSKKSGNQQPEKYFQGLMTGMIASLLDRFQVSSNGESGYGRFDLMLEPKQNMMDDAFILEFKVYDKKFDRTIEDTARRARAQIDEKQYDSVLRNKGYQDNRIHKFGIGFKGKYVRIII